MWGACGSGRGGNGSSSEILGSSSGILGRRCSGLLVFLGVGGGVASWVLVESWVFMISSRVVIVSGWSRVPYLFLAQPMAICWANVL